MSKRFKKILGVSILIVFMIGGLFMALGTPFDHFLTHDYSKASKEDQIAYLKKHEKEMTDYVKSQNPKVTSVQWEWESVEVETVQPNAGGFKTGDKYNVLSIEGGFNVIENSNFVLSFDFNADLLYPNIKHKSLTQPLRIGGKLYG